MASNYLAKQMSGPLAQSVIGSMEADYAAKNSAIQYYHDLSIDTAVENDLESIGLWIGMPWPTAPSSVLNGNAFLLGGSGTFPVYVPANGFSSVSNPSIGGVWVSVTPTTVAKIPINTYRSLLKWFARFKRDGFTIKSLDEVAGIFSTHYTIGYASNNVFTLAPGAVTTSDPLKGLAPDNLSSGGHFKAGGEWDINLVFTENVGAANVWVLQYIFNSILDAQMVFVSQVL